MPSGSVKSDDFAWQISCFNSLPRPSVRTAHSTARARGSWVPPRSFRCYRVRDERYAWRKLSSARSRPPACHSQTARRAQASALTSRPQARKPHHPRRLTLHRQQQPPPPQLLSRPRQKFVTGRDFAVHAIRPPAAPPAFTWLALAAFFDFVKFRGTSKQGATPSFAP